jgi:CMP-N-acetylneuraminic acid synthetase
MDISMEVLGLIPARGGSKSIPHKNIVDVAGKPLLAYTIAAARASQRLTRTILNTDDATIATVGRTMGVEVPFLRPAALAQDDTGALPVIEHTYTWFLEHERYVPDIVVYLQPTSPLRTAAHIDRAVDLLTESDADSVVSIVEVPHRFNPVSLMCMDVDGRLTPHQEGPMLLRRQDKPIVYARNGPAVLAIRRGTILEKKSLYGNDVRGMRMLPEDSFDIDTPFDLEIVSYLLARRR